MSVFVKYSEERDKRYSGLSYVAREDEIT